MKRFAYWVCIAVLGALLALITDVTIGTLWISLEWRKPVADWLISTGAPAWLTRHWSLVWINLPDWAVLVTAGAFIGRKAAKARWLQHALLLGAGFTAYSVPFSLWYISNLHALDPGLAVGTSWRLLAWRVLALVLLVLSAWLFRRRKAQPEPAATASS